MRAKERITGTQTAVTSIPDLETGPKVIPFFTTEADPEQIHTLHTLIAEYQRANPTVEIDIISGFAIGAGTPAVDRAGIWRGLGHF